MVILNIIDQFLQKITLIVSLQDVVLVGMLATLEILVIPVELMVERLHIVLKIKDLDDVSFASLARDLVMAACDLLVSELGLVILAIQIPMVVAPLRHSSLASSHILHLPWLLDPCLSTGHQHLDSFQVLLAGPHSLHQLQVFLLHVLMPFRQLVDLESQPQILLLRFSLRLDGSLHVLLVHADALVHFARVGLDSSVVLMYLLYVLDVSL